MTKVFPIKAGIANCFLVLQNNKFFLIDTGNAGYEDKIATAITSRGLKLKDLQFIFLTHTHYDHAGSTYAIKKMTGAKIIVHESEAEYLINGFHPMPKGTSPFFRFIVSIGKLNEKSRTTINAVKPDITFRNQLDLKNMGFNAKITHTPGHTKGSSSLIIDQNIFVGDTMFNIMGKIYPPFANDTDQLINSWKKLFEVNPKYYYPAHGKRISRDEFVKKMLKKYKL